MKKTLSSLLSVLLNKNMSSMGIQTLYTGMDMNTNFEFDD